MITMKYVLLTLFIPILSWSSPPDCARLKKIVEELEKRTADSNLAQKCSQLKIDEDLKPYLEAEKQNLSILQSQKNLIEEFKCKNLSAIDLKLRSIENELTLLEGIESLKQDIKNKGEAVKKLPKKSEVQEAAKKFIESLKIASTFEKVLKTEKDKESFLENLAKLKDDDLKDLKSFMGHRNVFCEDIKEKKGTICVDNFAIDETSLNELKAALRLMKPNKRFDSGKLKNLKNALEIKKLDNSEYSFSEMLSSINLPEDGSIGPSLLNAIKNMPDFKNDERFAFIDELKKAKNQIDGRSFVDRFNILSNELKTRQEFEIKSKLAIIFNQFSETISNSESTSLKCNSIEGINKEQITDCLNAIKDKLSPDEQSNKAALEDMIKGFSASIDYSKYLNDKSIACDLDEVLAQTGSVDLPESCLTLSKDKAKLFEELASLRALRNHVLKEKSELLTMRHLAISKLSPACAQSRISAIGECDTGLNSQLSREVSILSGSSNEIIAILDKTDPNNNYSQFCDGSSNKHFNTELCELLVKEPAKNQSKVEPGPPLKPDSSSRPGFGNFMKDFAGAMSQSIQQEMFRRQLMAGPRPMPQYNYPQFSTRPMSLNEKAFSSVPTLGLYQLTPGAAPGTSFHSHSSAFPVSSINSTYFQGGF